MSEQIEEYTNKYRKRDNRKESEGNKKGKGYDRNLKNKEKCNNNNKDERKNLRKTKKRGNKMRKTKNK